MAASDDLTGAAAQGDDGSAIISDRLWRSSFKADPAIVGQAITIDDVPHIVVGVLPQDFRFRPAIRNGALPDVDLFLSDRWPGDTGKSAFLVLMGRLAPGATPERAEAELTALLNGSPIVPAGALAQAEAHDRMTEVLRVQPKIDLVYGHNDPMAIGAYLAAKELGRDEEMLFTGEDGLGGPSGGIQKVMDGVLAATFVYPLGVKEAVEVGQKILRDPSYKPPKVITLDSVMVTPDNAADLYKKLTVAGE